MEHILKCGNYINNQFRLVKEVKLRGTGRGAVAKRNALGSFIIMILQNLVQLALVPIVIGYIEPLRYGIWQTVSSFLGWFTMMDIGLGGGFRNKLGEALAQNDRVLAKRYISAAYVFMACIAIILLLASQVANRFVSWSAIFNAPLSMSAELSRLMNYVVLFFVLKFTLQLINYIFTAFRKTAFTSFINFMGSFLSLVTIYFMANFFKPSLIAVGFIYSMSPVMVMLACTIFFFSMNKNRDLIPSLQTFSIQDVRPMLNIGVLILINQIAVLVIMTSTNMLISHITSPADVTPYAVAMRLFGFPLTVFEIMMVPLLPAFNHAYFAGDILWVRNTIDKARKLSYLVSGCVVIMIPLVQVFIPFWLKGKVEITWQLSSAIGLFVVLQIIVNVYSKLFNGTGKLKEITYLTVFNMVAYIPLAVLFGKYMKLGVLGIVSAQSLLFLTPLIIMPYLARRIIKQKEQELQSISEKDE